MAQSVSRWSRSAALSDFAQQQWLLQFSLLMGLAWLPALLGHKTIGAVAALFPLAESAQPYFIPAYGWLLYLWSPLVVLSACLLFLAPGLFLALALDRGKSVGQWIVDGFALTLLVLTVAAGSVQALLGQPLREDAFALVAVVCALAAWGFLWLRLTQGYAVSWPLSQPYARVTLLSMVLVPWLLLSALTPKFYWENFNGDGVHAFESTRLLLVQPLPFWSPTAGDIASFPGITSMLFAFPASWFIRLFGEVEASARLPFLLYLVVLYGALLELIEFRRTPGLGIVERGLLWLSLVTYTVVVAYSATYNPYAADLALPATQDTLLVVCFLGFILAFLRQEYSWLALFVALTFTSLPNGLLLIGFWVMASLLFWRQRPWPSIGFTMVTILGCLVFAALIGPLLTALQLPAPGREYGAVGLLRYFAFLQGADWWRIAFIVVPGGILPAAALLLWRHQDPVARTLTAVTIASFAFFYIQAHIVLHYFIPAMLLPLIVFWRNDFVRNFRPRFLLLTGVGMVGVLSLFISLPTHALPDLSARHIGASIEARIGDYTASDPAAFRHTTILARLFPYDWDPRVPTASYGGSPLVWNYYAHQPRTGAVEANYILQQSTDPAPAGTRLLAQEEGAALYIRSTSVWTQQLALRPPTPAGSSVYKIARGIIFRSVPLTDGPPIIQMLDVLTTFGVDADALLARLGVEQ